MLIWALWFNLFPMVLKPNNNYSGVVLIYPNGFLSLFRALVIAMTVELGSFVSNLSQIYVNRANNDAGVVLTYPNEIFELI